MGLLMKCSICPVKENRQSLLQQSLKLIARFLIRVGFFVPRFLIFQPQKSVTICLELALEYCVKSLINIVFSPGLVYNRVNA